MKKYNIPIFIPHEGCPHACVFCNQKKITGVETNTTIESFKDKVAGSTTTTIVDNNINVTMSESAELPEQETRKIFTKLWKRT